MLKLVSVDMYSIVPRRKNTQLILCFLIWQKKQAGQFFPECRILTVCKRSKKLRCAAYTLTLNLAKEASRLCIFTNAAYRVYANEIKCTRCTADSLLSNLAKEASRLCIFTNAAYRVYANELKCARCAAYFVKFVWQQ